MVFRVEGRCNCQNVSEAAKHSFTKLGHKQFTGKAAIHDLISHGYVESASKKQTSVQMRKESKTVWKKKHIPMNLNFK